MNVRLAWLWLALAPAGALACNPAAPVPPILEGYAYDRVAAQALARDAESVVTARFTSRVDLDLGDGKGTKSYLFEVIEGWKAVRPRQLAIDGLWVPCELDLPRGSVWLMYLDGQRLLYAVPGSQVNEELEILGDVAWFYGPGGELVEPVEQD